MAPYQMILCYFSQEQKQRSCALSSAGETPEHWPQVSPVLSREGLKCSYLLDLHSQLPSWCQDQGLGLANLVKTWDHMEVNHRPETQACKRWWISQNWSCEMSQLKDLSQNFVLKKKKSAYISCKTETNFKPFSSVCLVQINTLHCTRIPRQCFKVSSEKRYEHFTETKQKLSFPLATFAFTSPYTDRRATIQAHGKPSLYSIASTHPSYIPKLLGGQDAPEQNKSKELSVKNLGLILCNVWQLFREFEDAVRTAWRQFCLLRD